MALPAGIATVTITGTLLAPDGTPAVGSVDFIPSVPVLYIGPKIVTLPAKVSAVLVSGAFPTGFKLPATDDTAGNPTSWTWRVVERITGGRSFDVYLAKSPATLDYSSLSPVPTSAGVPVVVGPPGPATAATTDASLLSSGVLALARIPALPYDAAGSSAAEAVVARAAESANAAAIATNATVIATKASVASVTAEAATARAAETAAIATAASDATTKANAAQAAAVSAAATDATSKVAAEATTARAAESTNAANIAKTVPRWAPTTAYTVGQQVVSPNNDVVSRITAGTSGATYDASSWALSGSYLTPAVGNSTYVPLRGVNAVYMIGDSITAHGYTPPSGVNGPRWDSQSILMQTVLASAGRLSWGGQVGVSGYTTTQILATLVPQVTGLALKPRFCIVLGGTNDGIPFAFTAGALNTTQANLKAIWAALAAAGITPVCCTLTPRNDFVGASAGAASIQLLNHWIARQAAANGYPLLDLNGAVVDPAGGGGYKTGMNFDTVHPSDLGAATLGAYAATVLTQGMPTPPTQPFLANATVWPSAIVALSTNALFLAGAAGLPTGWAADSGVPTTAMTAMTATEGLGNFFAVTPSAANVAVSAKSTPNTVYVTGNRVLFAFKVKTAGVTAGASSFTVKATNSNEDAVLCSLGAWLTDIPSAAVFAAEFTVPAGMSTNNARITAGVGLNTGTGLATLSIGQITCLDLTVSKIDGV